MKNAAKNYGIRRHCYLRTVIEQFGLGWHVWLDYVTSPLYMPVYTSISAAESAIVAARS